MFRVNFAIEFLITIIFQEWNLFCLWTLSKKLFLNKPWFDDKTNLYSNRPCAENQSKRKTTAKAVFIIIVICRENIYLISSRSFPLFRFLNKIFANLVKFIYFLFYKDFKDKARRETYYSFSVLPISKTLLTREFKSLQFDWPMTFCFEIVQLSHRSFNRKSLS